MLPDPRKILYLFLNILVSAIPCACTTVPYCGRYIFLIRDQNMLKKNDRTLNVDQNSLNIRNDKNTR